MCEKYYNENGDLGVLVSHGFGAGWSTWNNQDIAIDKRVIEKYLENPSGDEMKEYLDTIGYENTYMGGYNSLSLEFIPKGTMFCIHEYDGAESIKTPETMCMMIAE